jgi:hypothetical protein
MEINIGFPFAWLSSFCAFFVGMAAKKLLQHFDQADEFAEH